MKPYIVFLYHLHIVLIKHTLNARHHLRSIGCVHLRHYHADGVGASHLKVHRHRVATVAKTLSLAKHRLTGLAMNVFVVGQSPRTVETEKQRARAISLIVTCFIAESKKFFLIIRHFYILQKYKNR